MLREGESQRFGSRWSRSEDEINRQIAELPLVGMTMGRKISIQADTDDEFFQEIVQHPHFVNRDSGYMQFLASAKTALTALQELGYILSYKLNAGHNKILVVC